MEYITVINPEAVKWGDDHYDRLLCPGLQPGPPSQTLGGLGQRYWSVSEVTWPPKLELLRWRSSGPSSLIMIWYWGSKWNLHTVCWDAVGCEWGTNSVYFGITLRESIPRLFNWGSTAMTAHCAPACSQILPVKTQGGLGQRYWSVSVVTLPWPPKLELQRWGSSGPYSLMTYVCFIPSRLPVFAVEPQYQHQDILFLSKVSFEGHIQNLQKI